MYADDTVIFANSMERLQTLIARIAEVSQRFGLEYNKKKTQYMVISKNQVPAGQLAVNQQSIRRGTNFTHLGTKKKQGIGPFLRNKMKNRES